MGFLGMLLLVASAMGCKTGERKKMNTGDEIALQADFDWQGHRGARGLAPENTLPAFIKALEYGVTTLELDLVVSADGNLVVSHEPWMNPAICTAPGGKGIAENEGKRHNIYKMTLAQVQQYDCGKRGNPRFIEQVAQPAVKPTLAQVVVAADSFCKVKKLAALRYNIEIKSEAELYDAYQPRPAIFAAAVLAEVQRLGIAARASIQSFDPQVLVSVHAQAPSQATAYLIENVDTPDMNLEKLDFIPTIYSPYYKLVDAELVSWCEKKGVKLIPWTVNEVEEMQRLIAMGVDGLISDYPDRMADVKARLQKSNVPPPQN